MSTATKARIPVVALRDMVVFPQVVAPLYVGRLRSLNSVDEAQKSNREILLLAQKDAHISDPTFADLYSVGTVARIRQYSKLPDQNVKILVEGRYRAKVTKLYEESAHLAAEVEEIPKIAQVSDQDRHLMRMIMRHLQSYSKLSNRIPDELFSTLEKIDDPDQLVDIIATHLPFKLKDRQEILELTSPTTRLERISSLIVGETEILKIDRKIKSRVRQQIEKTQRDYYLQEQLNAIQKELGDEDDPRSELQELEKRLSEKKMPEEGRNRALKEVKRLKMLGGHAAEAAVIRQYIDLVLELPWDEVTESDVNLETAEGILNADHYGLKDIKERILEFLAIRTRVVNPKSPILCFVGPPGVGKTSLGQSIAKALGRHFEKISLGGLRDEAELRGHRRTYIGAMPGKFLSALRKAKTSNPVILLDEIDKVAMDFRGDPSSVLLEVLDPDQNKTFADHYLDLEYDLSRILFLATANTLDTIPAPLRDRMEVIQLSGYTQDEKVAIARQFLIPREAKNAGLEDVKIDIEDAALRKIIYGYTRESGVRNLQREIGKIFRKIVREHPGKGSLEAIHISEKSVESYLGPARFRKVRLESENMIGLATGLAWTPTGGEVLNVEAVVVPGKGKTQITGQVGQVMQESVKAAVTFIRSRAPRLGIPESFFRTHDLHVHVPEGGIAKDGPSAGITMVTALLSAILKQPVFRQIGMTGEITLRGRVLPIGGLKEKILAAQRAGLEMVIFPEENLPDLRKIDPSAYKNLKLVDVSQMDQVLELALAGYKSVVKPSRAANDSAKSLSH